MRTILVLFGLTLALTLALKFIVAPRYGEDVAERFLERLKYIPSQTEVLSETTLARWLADSTHAKAIRGYVFPVLFPLDVLFLICLGLFLGLASTSLAERLGFLSAVPTWIWWILPAFYMVADLAEDTGLAATLKLCIPLTPHSFRLLSTLTALKLATVTLAIGQFLFLGALNLLLFFFPPGRPV
ncbi:hypothetical protein XH89_15680 [Bradyrhizobium sp. CCBAU 53340]|uniref:hypothetical protein n=1 Tax=Bradyrhizobium sp. CCBAU 53340 TaxID=1325112 RepID=UPI00188C91CB|nr:hypothetical protein [Bradyrhizobium sp. CCBAU 53340]QOZ44753.1 hypothetical protein XH89_15680 [Bradyrhizobium sp. CCBAU 53340]